MSNLPGSPLDRPTGRPSLGKYELIAILGHGGMADVYLAVSRGPAGFNKLVVVKRLRPELAADPGFRAMFHDEASLAARLSHPNCVTTFEVGEDRNAVFMAMEFLDGQPVNVLARESLKGRRPLEPPACARIVADALAGLHHAHELKDYNGKPLGIVHRDVSPHNIFVTYEGQVKMVDFGIAKAQSSAIQTEVGVLKGKVAYMAPEQAIGAPVDRRADVFAMGIVLWELLVHKKLMARDGTAATMHRLLTEPVEPPSKHMTGVDRELETIVMRALEREAKDRYQTAHAMRQALESYLHPFGGVHDQLMKQMHELFAETRVHLQSEIQHCMEKPAASTGEITTLTAVTGAGPAFDATPSHQGLTPLSSDVRSNPRRVGSTAQSETRAAPLAGSPPRRSVLPIIAVAVALVAVVTLAVFSWLRQSRHEGDRAAGAPSASASGQAALAVPAFESLLRLHGSNTIGAELGPLLAEAFLRQRGVTEVARRPGSKPEEVDVVGTAAGKPQGIQIEARGSGTAFEDLGNGTCDLGMASRPIKPAEADALKALGDLRLPGNEHVVGLDGIAVLVHPNNPLRSIDLERLHDLFTGKTGDWTQLGGPPGAVVVYARDDRSGTYDVFRHLVLGDDKLVADAKRFEDNTRLSTAVAEDVNGVGFAGFRYVNGAKALAVFESGSSPLYPSTFTIATEDYVLTRRLYLYTATSPKNPLVMDFVNFALSADGQKVVRATGFVDLTVTARDPAPCDAKCPPRYATVTKHARRLSLNFRFRPGSAELDTRALRDLDRLLEFLKTYPSPRILLLGFSDKGSDPGQSVKLSKERAQKVEEELSARGVRAAVVDGFGQEMPIASNASSAGRDKNRRVEVWLDKSD
jgi:phosphate transport system substrate-binding protein